MPCWLSLSNIHETSVFIPARTNLIWSAGDLVGHRHYWVLGTMPRCEKSVLSNLRSRDGNALDRKPTRLCVGQPRIRVKFSAAGKALFFSKASTPIAGHTQSHIHSVEGTIFSGIMQPGREAGRSPPPSNEITNAWSHRSSPTYRYFVLSRLTKHRLTSITGNQPR
jgi:hypothetical protein